MQKNKSDQATSGLSQKIDDSIVLLKTQSTRSQPTLVHNISSVSQESNNSLVSVGSTQQQTQTGKTSKLNIIKQKVSGMIKFSSKITLDSIKMQSINDFQSYMNIIQKPDIVTHFSSNNSQLGDQIIKSLKLSTMASLQFLSLQNIRLTGVGFNKLMNYELPCLKNLYLANNLIGDCQLTSRKINNLSLLSLAQNNISSKGISNLKSLFQTLQSLSLKNNPLKQDGLKELFKTKMNNLRYIHVETCQINNKSLEVLSMENINEIVPCLAVIYLNGNQIQSSGLQIILKSPIIKKIEVLNFQSSLCNQSLSIFKDLYKDLSKLTLINLSKNKLTDDLIKDLASIKLPLVNLINLQFNDISIASVKSLSKAEFPLLLHLLIDNNPQIVEITQKVKNLSSSFYSVLKGNNAKVFFNI